MKGIILAALATTVLTLAAVTSRSANAPDRPPGIAPQQWIAINERVGFIIVPDNIQALGPSAVAAQLLLLTPSVAGYFVVKGPQGWIRMVVVEPIKGPGDAG